MKKSTRSMIFAFIIIAAVIGVCVYAVVQNALAPREEREDTSYFTPKETVVLKASTFNGDIEVKPTDGSQIVVSCQLSAPNGYLKDIKATTAQTADANITTIDVTVSRPINQAVDYHASLIIMLPHSSSYNLTLTTSNGDVNIQAEKADEIGVITDNGDATVSLPKDTQFQVTASVAHGAISHQGITLDADPDSQTRLKGQTASGAGSLVLTLMSGNGDLSIKYR